MNRLQGSFELVEHLAYPMGSVKLLGVAPADEMDEFEARMLDARQALVASGVFTSYSAMEADRFPDDIRTGMQALAGSFFRPNLLFLKLPKDRQTHEALQRVIAEAKRQRIGVALLVRHDTAGLGRRRRINLWIPDQGPKWKMEMEFPQLDLAILLAYGMVDSWKNAQLRVIAAVEQKADMDEVDSFLSHLVDLARLPADTAAHVAAGDFGRFASSAFQADLNIFPLPEDELDADFLWSLRDATGASCLFTQDSGDESALAERVGAESVRLRSLVQRRGLDRVRWLLLERVVYNR